MLITRSPLRITFGGGGSDVPSYANRFGGFCISAAINKYCYVAINHTFTEGITLKYSSIENPKTANEIKHPIFREAMRLIGLKTPQIEIVSIADVPANGSGLGNSGAFTVALLQALYSYKYNPLASNVLAAMAADLNMISLKKIQGAQDEYISTYGGIQALTFEKGRVYNEPLNISHDTMIDLEENLMLFYTGVSHDTQSILKVQEEQTQESDKAMLENLHETKLLGYTAKEYLEQGRTKDFGELLNYQWRLKEARMPNNIPFFDEVHTGIPQFGGIGSKLVGSGMGGFWLVYAEDKRRLREWMKSLGLEELRFTFDFEGCKRII